MKTSLELVEVWKTLRGEADTVAQIKFQEGILH